MLWLQSIYLVGLWRITSSPRFSEGIVLCEGVVPCITARHKEKLLQGTRPASLWREVVLPEATAATGERLWGIGGWISREKSNTTTRAKPPQALLLIRRLTGRGCYYLDPELSRVWAKCGRKECGSREEIQQWEIQQGLKLRCKVTRSQDNRFLNFLSK